MGIRISGKCNNVIRNLLTNKNICIIGVDGTGKTCITNELRRILREGTTIQYMGHKKNRFDIDYNIDKHAISRFIILITRLVEMWYKVVNHWPNENIIIYDRYAWDRYINQRGFTRIITKMLFKTFFPKPKYIFYLYCPFNVSLGRKDDITDPVEFKRVKENYDAEFLCAKSVIAINTEGRDIESTIDIIIKRLPENYLSPIWLANK